MVIRNNFLETLETLLKCTRYGLIFVPFLGNGAKGQGLPHVILHQWSPCSQKVGRLGLHTLGPSALHLQGLQRTSELLLCTGQAVIKLNAANPLREIGGGEGHA